MKMNKNKVQENIFAAVLLPGKNEDKWNEEKIFLGPSEERAETNRAWVR